MQNKPVVRFPEFDDEWEQLTINNVLTESKIKGNTGEKAQKLTVKLWGKGVFAKEEKRQGSENTQYYARKKKQFIYSKLDFLNCAFGIIPNELDGYESTVDLPCFDISQHCAPFFLLERISQKNFYKKYGDKADGSRKAKRIHTATFLEMPIHIPSLAEQEKIATFLSNITTKISNLTQQKKCLQLYKKGCMQKLFSQEIRFKSDDGKSFPDWEEKKLGQIFSEVTTRGNNADELLSVTLNQGVVKRKTLDGKNNASNDRSNYKKVKKGDIAYNSMRMWQGASGVSNYEGIVSPAYTVIECSSGYYPSFFAYFFKWAPIISLFRRNSQGLTSDTWNCKYPLFSKIKATIPKSKDEQVKISNFLSVLDDKIEILDKQLEAMKEFKKGLLQGMFV
jgi:type I restriction enzyme S subunit